MFPLMKAEIVSEVKVEPITNQSRSSLKVISLPLIFVWISITCMVKGFNNDVNRFPKITSIPVSWTRINVICIHMSSMHTTTLNNFYFIFNF